MQKLVSINNPAELAFLYLKRVSAYFLHDFKSKIWYLQKIRYYLVHRILILRNKLKDLSFNIKIWFAFYLILKIYIA